MGILIPLLIIFFCCLLIWRACDGFETASEYIGRNLSEGFRGGTINAISSSLPELFTTLIALFVLSDKDGFAVGIGTTAGSALFNGMIIPALCIFFVIGRTVTGEKVTAVRVSFKVILRDGLALIFAQIVLVIILKGNSLFWWQGLILMILYVAYLWYMLGSMKKKEADVVGEKSEGDYGDDDANIPMTGVMKIFYWMSLGPLLDLEALMIRAQDRKEMRNGTWNGWPLLAAATVVIGLSCWLLVKGCEWLGTGSAEHPSYSLFGHELTGLGMPTMFVAVIFAAMATSVPDTIISIRDARDGDYDDAVANALGSNIFDICFALGFPLFLYTMIHGPITMGVETVEKSTEIRLLLLILTVAGFFVYFIGKKERSNQGAKTIGMKRLNAVLLLAIYGVFLVYILGRSADAAWATGIAGWLRSLVVAFPTFG